MLVCPVCHGDLAEESATALRCAACGHNFPVIAGIPDLRLESGPYISLEADRAKALLLERECAGLDFAGSVQRYYELADAVPAFQARRFIRSLSWPRQHGTRAWASTSRCAGSSWRRSGERSPSVAAHSARAAGPGISAPTAIGNALRRDRV
ncbi:MAG: Trm112 family protein [Longimicrobiales bacterium]